MTAKWETRYTVYGLRIRGEREVRYIGQTIGSPELRLQGHLNAANLRRHNHSLCDWIQANRDNIDAFAIGIVDTRAEAQAMERAIIALCLRLNNRLLNQRCLPAADMKAAA